VGYGVQLKLKFPLKNGGEKVPTNYSIQLKY
jgi:hypothetical protein